MASSCVQTVANQPLGLLSPGEPGYEEQQLQMQMADFESQHTLAGLGGETLIEHGSLTDPEVEFHEVRPGGYQGEYVQGYGEAREKEQDLIDLGYIDAPIGLDERDVLLYGERGLEPKTQAHELLHDVAAPDFSQDAHLKIYAKLGINASTKGEWTDAVEDFSYYLNETPEKAEEVLKQIISDNEELLLGNEAKAAMKRRAGVPNLTDENRDTLQPYLDFVRNRFDQRADQRQLLKE